jgi:phosphatidylglycerol lysyltransferase
MGRLERLWLVNLRLNTQDYIGRRTGRIAIAIGQCVGATSLIAAAELALQRYGRKIWTQRRLLLSVLGCTKADLLCAGLVIVLLAPPDLPLVLVLVLVLAVFLLAFGAGLASPVPMALGAFDLIVLVFLPAPVAAMLPAFLAFRLVYFVLPALCGGVAYWRPRALPGSDGLRQQLRLNTSAIWASSDQGATPVAHVLIGYPVKTVPRALRLAARYKCSACSAARLSAQGCPIMRIATIAWVDPCTCTTAGPSRTSPAA